MNQITVDGILVTRPTTDDVMNLMTGDKAPDCFNGMAEVVEIFARDFDRHGNAFVCYHFKTGTGNGTMSMSIKAGEPVQTVAATAKWGTTLDYPLF